jgi:hypothetical protein
MRFTLFSAFYGPRLDFYDITIRLDLCDKNPINDENVFKTPITKVWFSHPMVFDIPILTEAE